MDDLCYFIYDYFYWFASFIVAKVIHVSAKRSLQSKKIRNFLEESAAKIKYKIIFRELVVKKQKIDLKTIARASVHFSTNQKLVNYLCLKYKIKVDLRKRKIIYLNDLDSIKSNKKNGSHFR